jgi:hypothetical protein
MNRLPSCSTSVPVRALRSPADRLVELVKERPGGEQVLRCPEGLLDRPQPSQFAGVVVTLMPSVLVDAASLVEAGWPILLGLWWPRCHPGARGRLAWHGTDAMALASVETAARRADAIGASTVDRLLRQ